MRLGLNLMISRGGSEPIKLPELVNYVLEANAEGLIINDYVGTYEILEANR